MVRAKFDGKSLFQLRKKGERISALMTVLSEMHGLLEEARRDYRVELGRVIGRNGADLRVGESSPCELSPIDLCVFDMSTDVKDDECLFCGGPEERE